MKESSMEKGAVASDLNGDDNGREKGGKLPEPKQLPKSLQNKLDDEDYKWLEAVYPEHDGLEGSPARYAAYASRLRTIMATTHRYVAYSSDIGESFRPVAHAKLVRMAYAVSWMYIGGDVFYQGYNAYRRNQQWIEKAVSGKEITSVPRVPLSEDYRVVAGKRAAFQGIASMLLPALTIHTIVRYSGQAMRNIKNKTLRVWGPVGLGLAAIPILPYLFDEPVERTVEWTFKNAEQWIEKRTLQSSTSKEKEL